MDTKREETIARFECFTRRCWHEHYAKQRRMKVRIRESEMACFHRQRRVSK